MSFVFTPPVIVAEAWPSSAPEQDIFVPETEIESADGSVTL